MDVTASLHVHGVDYDIASDGTQMNKSHVEPGGTRTYTWRTHAPGRREDGTWRAGQRGLLALPRPRRRHRPRHRRHPQGAVRAGRRAPQGRHPARQDSSPIVFNDMTINNKPGARRAPTSRPRWATGVEIVMITHGEYYHTFHIHGHRWADNRTGHADRPRRPQPGHRQQDLGPADSFGFQVIAGERVGAGAWMYHCHVQSHSDMGMAGLFLVQEAGRHDPGLRPARALHEHRVRPAEQVRSTRD